MLRRNRLHPRWRRWRQERRRPLQSAAEQEVTSSCPQVVEAMRLASEAFSSFCWSSEAGGDFSFSGSEDCWVEDCAGCSSTDIFSFSSTAGVDSSVFSSFFPAPLPTTCVTSSRGEESVGSDCFSSASFCFSSIFVKADARSDISAIAGWGGAVRPAAVMDLGKAVKTMCLRESKPKRRHGMISEQYSKLPSWKVPWKGFSFFWLQHMLPSFSFPRGEER